MMDKEQKTDMKDIVLSVYVPTYNHEKYIARALDSILMQKTDFAFEVLVGEDCSTDGTRAVLQQYEKDHPGFFKMFYREQNMHGSGCSNALDLKRRCKGKYIVALEGDDFWTDPEKLDKQIRFLEQHPEYIAVSHRCVVVGEDSTPNGEQYPGCGDEEYTFRHFFSEIMPGQLATVMYRNYFLDDTFDRSLMEKGLTPGDRLMYFAFLCHGRVFCMQEEMSAYRHITTHGTSFSATNVFRYDRLKAWHRALIEYANRYCQKAQVSVIEYQYVHVMVKAVLKKQITLKQAWQDYREIQYKATVFYLIFKRIINKKVLKKKLYG